MSGLTGIGRLPRDTVRARRNAMKFASTFSSMLGDGLEVTGAGLIAIDLAATPGLEFTGGDLEVLVQSPLICDAGGIGIDPGNGLAISGTELVVDLAANPGLEFSGGDLICKVAAPIALDVTGIHLDWDTNYFALSGINLSIVNPITANLVSNNDITAATFTATNAINEFSTDGTLVGNSDSALPTEQAVKTYVDAEIATCQPLDADLTSIALLGTAADIMIYTTVAHTWAETALTAAGRAILDDADAAAQCDTLGLGAADAVGFGSVTTGALTIGALNGVLLAGAGVVGGGAGIADLANVTIAAVVDNEVLAYNNATSQWINQTAAEAGVASAGRQIISGDGLSGGGDLSANRTLAVDLSATPGLEISGTKLQVKVNGAKTIVREAAGIGFDGIYANTTENYNAAQSADTIQAAIDALPKYIASDVTLTFQFADGTYTLSHALTFGGFWGGGSLDIKGNMAESGLHTNQAVILDFDGQSCHGIVIDGVSCRLVRFYNLHIQVATTADWNAAVRIAYNQASIYGYYNYLEGNSAAKGYGVYATATFDVYLYQNYMDDVYAAIYATSNTKLSSHENDDTGTPPAYGLSAAYNAAIGKRGTQPAGSTANEVTSYGGVIR